MYSVNFGYGMAPIRNASCRPGDAEHVVQLLRARQAGSDRRLGSGHRCCWMQVTDKSSMVDVEAAILARPRHSRRGPFLIAWARDTTKSAHHRPYAQAQFKVATITRRPSNRSSIQIAGSERSCGTPAPRTRRPKRPSSNGLGANGAPGDLVIEAGPDSAPRGSDRIFAAVPPARGRTIRPRVVEDKRAVCR